MKRVLKLKMTQIHSFAHEKSRDDHMTDLVELRNICEGDFCHLIECITDLPSTSAILERQPMTNKQARIEDRIIASCSVLLTETSVRVTSLLYKIWEECIDITGPPPCRYTLVGNRKFGSKDIAGLEPVSIFLLLEKESAGLKSFFRNLLVLFGMKINNLGETALNSLGIRSLGWLWEDSLSSSAFSLANYYEDIEKKPGFSTVPIECLYTPNDLMRKADGIKASERRKVLELCGCNTYIAGDFKLYKELANIRQAVIHRDQTEKDYKTNLFSTIACLLEKADPFARIAMKENYEGQIRQSILDFSTELLSIIFNTEKNFTAESTIGRLEELMPSSITPMYYDLSLMSESAQGSNDVTTKFINDPGKSSPDPHQVVKLPKIRNSIAESRTGFDTWLHGEGPSISRSPTPTGDEEQILRKLKQRKADRRRRYSEYYRGYMVKPSGESVGYIHPLKRSSILSNTAAEDSEDEDDADFSPRKPAVRNSVQKKNSEQMLIRRSTEKSLTHRISQQLSERESKPASSIRTSQKFTQPPAPSNRHSNTFSTTRFPAKLGKGQEKMPKPPTPEPVIREVSSPPTYSGKQKDMMTAETARSLILLHSLSLAVRMGQMGK